MSQRHWSPAACSAGRTAAKLSAGWTDFDYWWCYFAAASLASFPEYACWHVGQENVVFVVVVAAVVVDSDPNRNKSMPGKDCRRDSCYCTAGEPSRGKGKTREAEEGAE